ncbi:hypothetical protein [Streptomyces griseosporeus]|uniref:hypothetical protein n=1 Tax=Streptomyces griseosporeus TaxID=1910 RepID=UPI0037036187
MEHGTDKPPEQPTPTATPWPEDVTHRYLTKAAEITGDHALYVEVRGSGERTTAVCTGCGRDEFPDFVHRIHQRAQAHAERCRALPCPETQR